MSGDPIDVMERLLLDYHDEIPVSDGGEESIRAMRDRMVDEFMSTWPALAIAAAMEVLRAACRDNARSFVKSGMKFAAAMRGGE